MAVMPWNFPTYEPNTCTVSNGFASMGIAVPGGSQPISRSIRTSSWRPATEFLMNAAEIETATRVSCGFTILLFNDDYGLISEKQVAPTGGSFGTRLTNPDFVDFANSFGIESYRPESSAEYTWHFTPLSGASYHSSTFQSSKRVELVVLTDAYVTCNKIAHSSVVWWYGSADRHRFDGITGNRY